MLFDRVWHIFILWVVRDVCSGWFMLEQRGDSENQATRKSNKQKWVQWIWFFGPANCPVLGDLVLKSFLILTPIIYIYIHICWFWECLDSLVAILLALKRFGWSDSIRRERCLKVYAKFVPLVICYTLNTLTIILFPLLVGSSNNDGERIGLWPWYVEDRKMKLSMVTSQDLLD